MVALEGFKPVLTTRLTRVTSWSSHGTSHCLNHNYRLYIKVGRVSSGLKSESNAEVDDLQYLWGPLGVTSINPWLQFTLRHEIILQKRNLQLITMSTARTHHPKPDLILKNSGRVYLIDLSADGD